MGRILVRCASLLRLGVSPLIVDAYPLVAALYHLLDRFLSSERVLERRSWDTVAVSPLLDVVERLLAIRYRRGEHLIDHRSQLLTRFAVSQALLQSTSVLLVAKEGSVTVLFNASSAR